MKLVKCTVSRYETVVYTFTVSELYAFLINFEVRKRVFIMVGSAHAQYRIISEIILFKFDFVLSCSHYLLPRAGTYAFLSSF